MVEIIDFCWLASNVPKATRDFSLSSNNLDNILVVKNVSDESIIEPWTENICCRYFCGETHFVPCAPAKRASWRIFASESERKEQSLFLGRAFASTERMRKKRSSKQTLRCKKGTSRFRSTRSCIGILSKNIKPSARKISRLIWNA